MDVLFSWQIVSLSFCIDYVGTLSYRTDWLWSVYVTWHGTFKEIFSAFHKIKYLFIAFLSPSLLFPLPLPPLSFLCRLVSVFPSLSNFYRWLICWGVFPFPIPPPTTVTGEGWAMLRLNWRNFLGWKESLPKGFGIWSYVPNIAKKSN